MKIIVISIDSPIISSCYIVLKCMVTVKLLTGTKFRHKQS